MVSSRATDGECGRLFSLRLLLMVVAYYHYANGQQVGVSLQLLGQTIPNNSLVNHDDLLYVTNDDQPTNANGLQTLMCVTDLVECCESPMLGDWYYPDGGKVTGGSSVTFRTNRGQNEAINEQQFYGSVRLWRRFTPPERGHFHCELPDAENVIRHLYVNILFFIHTDSVSVTISTSGSTTAGESYSLTCSATLATMNPPLPDPNIPSPTFEWFFGPNGNAPLPPGLTPAVTVLSSGTYTSTLQFSQLGQPHSGNYTCRLGAGTLVNSAVLIVNSPSITVSITSNGVVPTQGQTGLSFTCDIGGAENLSPIISYQWIKTSDTQFPEVIGTSRVLNFSQPLDLCDAGLYTCQVTITSSLLNTAVSNSLNVTLQLQGCEEPQLDNSIMSYYNSTCSEMLLVFWCKTGWSPNEEITSRCTNGHQWTPDPVNHICNDINECESREESPCPTGSYCLNTNGSFVCSCGVGYHFVITNEESQGMCIDVDECAFMMPCDENAKCINSDGSFSCVCNPGYVGNGKTCDLFNDDSCLQVCDQHCILIDTEPFTRICACDHGYYLDADEHTCRDVNECFDPILQNCVNAQCINTNGSFECDCLTGYIKPPQGGNICEDIDECTTLPAPCHVNAICNNTEGSYDCDCQPPYFNADNSNDCILGVGPKINHTTVEENPNHNLMYSIGSDFCIEDPTNTPFHVTIVCPLGNKPQPPPEFRWSILNNSTKEDFNGLPSLQVFHENGVLNLSGTVELGENVSLAIICIVDNQYGNDAENTLISLCGPFECQDGVTNNCSKSCTRTPIHETMSYEYECACDMGFAANRFGYCEDIDECQDTGAHNCSTNAWCINKVGSVGCRCKEGYDGDGVTCTLSRKVVISVTSVGIVIVFIILTNVTIAGCIKTYRKFKPSTIVDNIRRKIESRSLNKHLSLDKADSQDIRSVDINEYAITVSNPQRVTVKGSIREKLPPGLTIKSSHIRIGESIGQGEFGIVYKGYFVKNSPEVIAIKTLKGFCDENAVAELLTECTKMSTFNHPNVLTVKGVCLDGGPLPCIIMPYMANGSLLSFLKKERANLVLTKDADSVQLLFSKKRMMDMCLQVAKGMEYLAGEGIIHRDLAARNCMIGMDLVIKVADFGLAVNAGNKDYYRITSDMGIKLPLKWMAPESLTDYIFSEMSDVWAYGVTCWEVFSGGQIPYAAIKPSSILVLLQQGERLEMPTNYACSDDIYSMMLWCWEMKPDKRPSFSTLVHSISISLEVIADYLRLVPAVIDTETIESAV